MVKMELEILLALINFPSLPLQAFAQTCNRDRLSNYAKGRFSSVQIDQFCARNVEWSEKAICDA